MGGYDFSNGISFCGQVKEGMSHLLRGFQVAGGKFGPQAEEYAFNAVIVL